MKKTLTFTALVLSSSTIFAASPLVKGGRSIVNGGRSVASGAAAAGSGLLKAPGKLLSIGNDSLPNLSAGVSEFSLSGNVNWSEDTAYNLKLGYGYFFRDNWQVGFQLDVQGVEEDLTLGLGLFTEYNFVCDSKWVPYIGLSASWAHLDGDAFDKDSIALGLDLGIKYFVRENLAISFSVGADYAFDDVFPGGDDFAKQINIGTRFYF